MRHLHQLLICAVLSVTLAGCTGQPSGPGTAQHSTPAPTTCAPDETVQDNRELSATLRKALRKAQIMGSRVRARVHTRQCQDPVSTQGALPSMTGVDTDIRMPIDDLAQPALIGDMTGTVVAALEEVTPGMPGNVALTFVNRDVELALSFTRDQARQAKESGLDGAGLLAALGYPPVANSGGTCVPVWGKQPLPELTRLARAAFDEAELPTVEVAAAAMGTWCADRFTAAYTEYHVDIGWSKATQQTERNEELGLRLVPVVEALHSLPQAQVPGDLPPRFIVVMGWFGQNSLGATLPDARDAIDAGLSGAKLVGRLRRLSSE